MPKYIKTHSNYVLKKKHQDVSDGRIWERDITTIGGVNQFSPSQTPIYKSSNFIITVRNDGNASNQYNSTRWESNGKSEVWTLENLNGLVNPDSSENDLKIVLKNDYYDFCDFAYYGSLSELFRASINDAVSRFPGELFGTSEVAYYTSAITIDFDRIEESIQLGDKIFDDGNCPSVEVKGRKTTICELNSTTKVEIKDRYVDNPFSIDIHSIKKPFDAEKLKFFADGGFSNYNIISRSEDGSKITSWKTKNFIKVVRDEHVLDSIYGKDAFYRDYLKPNVLSEYFKQDNNEIWWMESDNDAIKEKSIKYDDSQEVEGSVAYDALVESFQSGEIRDEFDKYQTKYWIEKRESGTRGCECVEYSAYNNRFYTKDEYEDCKAYVERLNEDESDENIEYFIGHGAMCCDIECYVSTPCKGYKTASVSASTGVETVIIDAWVGDNDEIVYMSKNAKGVHIRPLEEFVDAFYDECDHFERILLSRKTTPLYKSSFSVIKENERGYYREMETFVFPTTYGGYNLDVSEYGLNDFTSRLAEIGAYYDELFTDNLYRSMTHEAIKNFDWTYTRDFYVGDEEEYAHGGEKIQKALRVFAREFDETLLYINNIKNVNRVTYDERNNIPDYFLVDEANKKGWDTILVYPYDLDEYYYDDNNNKQTIEEDKYVEKEQLDNKLQDGKKIYRVFKQNAQNKIRPYSKEYIDKFPNGYFVVCDDSGEESGPCEYGDQSLYTFKKASANTSTYYDSKVGKIKNKIQTYSDEREYTYQEANNAFLRNLVINANNIWRHKGTLEGIEMLLSLFGLRSKRWIERLPEYECREYMPDYEINEYTSFAERIEEKWDAVHQMYRIDWINSTKTIVYDYRSMSNYTQYGAMPDYIPYQGLPVSYRDEYILSDNEPYIKVSALDFDKPQETTNDKTKAFKRIDTNNGEVVRRYLYPNFEKYEQIDGGVFFQMNGGWMSKTLSNSKDGKYNFQFDVDDNIAYTCHVARGYVSNNGDVNDNHPIYKETVRNIKRVDNIQELISTPIDSVSVGDIVYVSMVEKDIAIIDNEVFGINYEYVNDSKTLRYVTLRKTGGVIQVGDSKFFDTTVVVYDKNSIKTMYTLDDKEDGYEIKAYITSDDKFICQATSDDNIYTIDSFVIFDNTVSDTTTNYFIIHEPYYANRIATDDIPNGWKRLDSNDAEYIKINTIKNYYGGNNPHNGNMAYDGGHEYFTYFKRLFKHAMDNDLFDERCYESFFYNYDEEIGKYGFKGLIDENEDITQYFPYILNDTKIHYFGNYYKCEDGEGKSDCNTVMWYGENTEKMAAQKESYKHIKGEDIKLEKYILNEDGGMINGSPYASKSGDTVDEVTNQIVNNKRLTIKFNLHKEWHTKEGQCEVKYLDAVVLPYLAQMIPSTTIVDIAYVYQEKS